MCSYCLFAWQSPWNQPDFPHSRFTQRCISNSPGACFLTHYSTILTPTQKPEGWNRVWLVQTGFSRLNISTQQYEPLGHEPFAAFLWKHFVRTLRRWRKRDDICCQFSSALRWKQASGFMAPQQGQRCARGMLHHMDVNTEQAYTAIDSYWAVYWVRFCYEWYVLCADRPTCLTQSGGARKHFWEEGHLPYWASCHHELSVNKRQNMDGWSFKFPKKTCVLTSMYIKVIHPSTIFTYHLQGCEG